MQRYLAWRLLLFIPTLAIASMVIFGIMRALPGDVALVVLSGSGEVSHDIEQVESVREELGLKDPLVIQYGRWLWSMANGEFGGQSLENREAIRSLVARQLPVTLQLTLYAVVLSIIVSVPLGVLAALQQDRWPDYLVRMVTISGQAIPNFLLALLVMVAFMLIFHWSPPIMYKDLWEDPWIHLQIMIWPTLVLGWGYSSLITRVTRSSMLEVLGQDYIRTARGKGLAERKIVFRHGFRNALIPIITVGGLELGGLISGVVIIESIFGLPGLGRGVIQAVTVRDYPVIQSLAMLLVFLMLCINLTVDTIYAIVDPRISYST